MIDFTSQLARAMLKGPIGATDIEELILGNVLQAGNGQGATRQVGIKVGLSYETPAFSVNQVCGSGMTSVILGTQKILCGERSVILTGGMESMSRAPYLSKTARFGIKLGNNELIDSILSDALTDNLLNIHMGVTAENIAKKFAISREEQDEFSLESHLKVERAWEKDKFKDEICTIQLPNNKYFNKDEHFRENMKIEQLMSLKPVFLRDGTVTAGNSSGINDGAALLLLMSKNKAIECSIPYLAEIESYATSGVSPEIMGLGPIASSKLALKKANLTIEDIDLFELNEAFASQAIAVKRELKIPDEKLNINGGAIALGHPVGCSGARIIVTLLNALKHNGMKRGLASLCVGGGMGVSIVIKRKGD